ncbi:DUF58 domain-containing protein [Tamlana fucoidanivorans]|uniref:DUF58 domain-containing protein n=1 Tax=Allotamlana fucoidanivorans TaxID=2583814 RepID=A0A5C4SFW7_9FLAO|nr:DUF58 domain-containing protein [Tamlana fucoidanivorans]TNJ42511.1 DUF58 domain-containing protein [Tamlana fucoidanivorans]
MKLYKKKYSPPNVFLSLEHLLKLEVFSSTLQISDSKNKSNSILSGQYASKLRGRGLDFEEVRPYIFGDDIRNIDWKVTAKTGKTHTKIFTEEKEKPVFIFVDQSSSMGFGSKNKTKAFVAGEIASIIAHKTKKKGDRVGGLVFGEDYEIITPKRDARNSIYFLQKIVEANQNIYNYDIKDFDNSLAEMFAKVNNIVTHDYVVFIISDFHRYNPAVIKYLSQLGLHNDIIMIKVFDELEDHIPNAQLTITNKTKQINLNGKNSKTKEKVEATFEKEFTDFKSELSKYNITLLKVNCCNPIEEELLEVFSNL